MKKVIVVSAVIVVFLIVVVVTILENGNRKRKVYVDDYFLVLGFYNNGKYIHSYNDIIEVKGTPLWVEEVEAEMKVLHYSDYAVTVYENNGEFWAGELIISNPDIRFGSKKIGVGSSKAEVEKAYFPIEQFVSEEGIYYVDGIMCVEYCFDEEDIVISIKIGIAEIWW